MAAPSVSAQAPAPDSINVQRSTNIAFHIGGLDGVTLASLTMTVQIGSSAVVPVLTAGVPQFPYDGSSSLVAVQGDGYDVTIDYRGIFPPTVVVGIIIDADSTLAEPMATVNYNFSTDNAELTGVQLVQIAQA